MLLSVIFSFRNEETVLQELVLRVISAIGPLGLDFEIIFVNDDSNDRSLEILRKLRESDKRIKIINMSRRFGVHPCVIAGLKHAKGDAVVYMDTDLQDPPELIPQLVEEWRAGADVVNTVRTERAGESALKLWLTKKAYRIINFLSDIDLPVNMGDFKLLSRTVVDELLKIDEQDLFMRGLVRWVGFKQETVYYKREARFAGKTHFSLFGTGPAKEFIRGLTSFSLAPLYFALIIGGLVSISSFILTGYVLITYAMGLNVQVWTVVLISTLFLGGMILLTNGFLGLYIGRIHNQVKNRPLYIIKEKIGIDDLKSSQK